jgi:hypothetical protein
MLLKPPIHDHKKISLADLLKRRRASLKKWCKEVGIQTYDQLIVYCDKIGVVAPSEAEWESAAPRDVTVPTEGIIHFEVNPLNVLDEKTGEVIVAYTKAGTLNEKFKKRMKKN